MQVVAATQAAGAAPGLAPAQPVIGLNAEPFSFRAADAYAQLLRPLNGLIDVSLPLGFASSLRAAADISSHGVPPLRFAHSAAV